MLSGPGLLKEAVRMEEQQVGNDSRLSLDQHFSGGARRPSSRLRHQSLDRRFTRVTTEDSQAVSQSLGQRTIGADDKLQAAARSVCASIPVALSVHCSTDEPDRNLDEPDESLELLSLGQRTTCAEGGLPTTLSTTVGSMDDIVVLKQDCYSQPRWFNNSDCCSSTTGLNHLKTAVEQQDNIVVPQRPAIASMHHSQGRGQASVVLGQDCCNQTDLYNSDDCCLSNAGFHHLNTTVEQQDNIVVPQRSATASMHHDQGTRRVPVVLSYDCCELPNTSSHSASISTKVDGWTSDGFQSSSISRSAGAQLRNTDKASRTDIESGSAAHDTQARMDSNIGSTGSRPVTLGWRPDLSKEDDRATSHVGSIGHQSASGGKSANHPDYASPDRPKVVDVDLQVDLDSWNVEKELVTYRQGGPNRFSTASYARK